MDSCFLSEKTGFIEEKEREKEHAKGRECAHIQGTGEGEEEGESTA